MTEFKWKQSDIDWLLKNFGDSTNDIKARSIQIKYQRWKKSTEKDSNDSQDFRNLMRFAVHKKKARVSAGHVTSSKYCIKIVSSKYPYIQELFDKELFEKESPSCLFNGLDALGYDEIVDVYPSLGIEEWDVSCQRTWNKSLLLAKLYINALIAYNLLGGDFDKVFIYQASASEHDCVSSFAHSTKRVGKTTINQRDSFCLQIHSYICQYKLFKLAFPDIILLLDSQGIERLWENHNSLFLDYFKSDCLLNFIQEAIRRNAGYLGANRTRYNKIKEVIERFLEGTLLSVDEALNPSNKLTEILQRNLVYLRLPSISKNPDVLTATEDCLRAYLAVRQSLANGLREDRSTPTDRR